MAWPDLGLRLTQLGLIMSVEPIWIVLKYFFQEVVQILPAHFSDDNLSRLRLQAPSPEGRFVHVYVDNADGPGNRPVHPLPDRIRAVVSDLTRPAGDC